MDSQHLNLMDEEVLRGTLESLLFIYGDTISYKKLSNVLRVDESAIVQAIETLQRDLQERGRGLRIVSDGKSAQMVTAPEFSGLLQAVVKEEFSEIISPASLETLSIIAYRGPMARSEIDYIRGVNSTFILRSLLIRGLLARYENPGRPNSFLYKVSPDLMRMLGIEKIEDLPEYDKYNKLSYDEGEEMTDSPHKPELTEQGSVNSRSGGNRESDLSKDVAIQDENLSEGD